MTTKRAHSTSPEPYTKLPRGQDFQERPFICELPPTCNRTPTHLAGAHELERHYATYHAHVCEDHDCSCVFPDARLLELHQTECHDPLAALRKDRGEKIFACYLAACNRPFASPKARRLHLISAHNYPKEYFFAVTNKGIGGLLKRWGEGASMIRGEWKPREKAEMGVDEDDEDDSHEDVHTPVEATQAEEQTSNTKGHQRRVSLKTFRLADGPLIEEDDEDEEVGTQAPDATVDALAGTMDSLSLVPTSVRFGRGAKGGGSRQPRAPAEPMDVDEEGEERRGKRRGRGRGKGRGRAPRESTEGDTANDSSLPRPGPPMPPRGLGRRAGFLGRGRIYLGSR